MQGLAEGAGFKPTKTRAELPPVATLYGGSSPLLGTTIFYWILRCTTVRVPQTVPNSTLVPLAGLELPKFYGVVRAATVVSREGIEPLNSKRPSGGDEGIRTPECHAPRRQPTLWCDGAEGGIRTPAGPAKRYVELLNCARNCPRPAYASAWIVPILRFDSYPRSHASLRGPPQAYVF